MTDELLSCPFCEAPAERSYTAYQAAGEPAGMHWAGCGDCGISTNACDTEAEATALWNRRARPSAYERNVLAAARTLQALGERHAMAIQALTAGGRAAEGEYMESSRQVQAACDELAAWASLTDEEAANASAC